MTELIDVDETLDGYTQVGGNGEGWQPPSTLIEAAIREIERQDESGHCLKTVQESSPFITPELRREEAGWTALSTTTNNIDMSPRMRMHTVWKARQYARHDGISKQILSLYTNFGIGVGFQFDVMADKASGNDTKARVVLDDLIKANPKTFGAQGQRANSDALYTDGELFMVMFVGADTVNIRGIDPLEITHIITDPEDRDRPVMYIRQFMKGTKQAVTFYLDWNVDDADIDKVIAAWPDGVPSFDRSMLSPDAIYHIKLGGRGKRGDSGLLGGMDWSLQYRNFMTARAAITLAIASLAYKLKIKGSAGNIAAIKSQRGTALSGSTSSGETNPPQVAGSTWLENAGAELTTMKQETGAAAAKVDAGLFMQMAGLPSGIFPHYFGSDNSFRLATATAMEPPMMKTFEAYQGLWADVYENIILWVWNKMDVPEAEQSLNTTASPIQESNTGAILESVTKLVTTFPALADSEDLMKWALQTLGINDADELIKALELDNKINSAGEGTTPPVPPAPVQPFEKVTRGTVAAQMASVLREVVDNQDRDRTER